MTNSQTAPLRVDIVSDIMCPWCIVGYKQFEQALEKSGLTADIHWHPFELNPNMPAEGQNTREHVAEKYGTSTEDSLLFRGRLKDIGDELGFTFNHSDDMRIYNTFEAHQLLHWAGTQGKHHELKMELFTVHFNRLENMADHEVLADAAKTVGLDRDEALAVLKDGRFATTVRENQQSWTSRGINSVPAMIFNQKHLVPGAQGVENYMSILDQLSKENAA